MTSAIELLQEDLDELHKDNGGAFQKVENGPHPKEKEGMQAARRSGLGAMLLLNEAQE